jgi:hypothetical protein
MLPLVDFLAVAELAFVVTFVSYKQLTLKAKVRVG